MRPLLREWASGSASAAVAPATAAAAVVRGLPSETRGRRGAEPEPESVGEGGAVEGSKNFKAAIKETKGEGSARRQ